MPPRPKFTREDIIEKAYELARKNGIESVVARELGKQLGTSSSPIFTAFKIWRKCTGKFGVKHLRNLNLM